jgi:hypothetical protein
MTKRTIEEKWCAWDSPQAKPTGPCWTCTASPGSSCDQPSPPVCSPSLNASLLDGGVVTVTAAFYFEGNPLLAGETRQVGVAPTCGAPVGAKAIAVNVTAVQPTDGGNLRFYLSGRTPGLASVLNFAPGRTRANNAIVKVSYDQIGVACDMPPRSTGSTHLVIDAYGYFP